MELFHFESEIQERTRKQWDQQKEQAKLQKEENRDRWRNLCYITQNQRFSKKKKPNISTSLSAKKCSLELIA
ncbi:unnamed protein product [Caretta caretta]